MHISFPFLNWSWRGHQIRYCYRPSQAPTSEPSKPPLLLIHGFGASVQHWRSNIPALSHDRAVYAIDLLGFGGSDKSSTVYGTAIWVEQVFDFVRQVIGRSVVVVGNSLGSVVGLGFAAKHPESVTAIAWLNLPDFSAVSQSRIFRAISIPLGAIAKRAVTFPPFFVPFFRILRRPSTLRTWVKGAYVNQNRIDAELLDLLSSPAYSPNATRALATMVRSQRALPPEYTARGALPHLQIPMLLVWGDRDTFVPPSIAQKIVTFNPNVQLVYLKDVGHCPHDDAPEQFNQLLQKWLDEQPLSQAN